MIAGLLVAASLVAGVLLQRTAIDAGRWVAGLNRYIITLALPALILSNVPGMQFRPDALFPMLVPWLLAALSFVSAFILGRLLGWRLDLTVAVALLGGLGNTAFFGLPLVHLVLGEEALSIAVIYDQLGSFLVLALVATTAIALLSGDAESVGPRQLLWRVISFPPFLSLILALLLPASILPAALTLVFDLLAASILPLAMLIVGLQLSIRVAREQLAPLVHLALWKLLLMPPLVLWLGHVLDVDAPVLQPTLLQSAMPPMVTPAIMLVAAGIVPGFVATALGLLTLLSFVSVPMWIMLLL